MLRYILFFLGTFWLTYSASAQTPFCIDSLRIKYGAYCPPDFEPVCGCDGVTYRNHCFADNNGLINYNYGICEDIVIDANPNPTLDNIYIRMILKFQGNADLYIYNHYGKLYYYKRFIQVTDVYLPLYIEYFDIGPYIIVARTGDALVTKKIIKQGR